MNLKSSWALLLVLVSVAGCNSSSTPPGAKIVNDKTKGPEMPTNAIAAGSRYALPPQEWGTPDSMGGVKAFKIQGDQGTVRVDIFRAPGSMRASADQVARFKAMIEPATAVKVDELQVNDMTVSRVAGSGTRLTFRGDDTKDVGSRYENEGVIGLVFGKPDADLLIMVSGNNKAVEAFAPKLESWVKSFK